MPRKKARIGAVVIDASCLICLWDLDLLPKLSLRYNTVYIPRHVLDEARRKGRAKKRLQELIEEYDALLKVCDVGNPFDAQLLYDRFLNPESPIHRGEAEVIIQAREQGVSEVLIDDKDGRKIAMRHTLNVRGTLGVLIELKQIEIIEEVKPLIAKLGSKLRISRKVLKEELEKVGEIYD